MSLEDKIQTYQQLEELMKKVEDMVAQEGSTMSPVQVHCAFLLWKRIHNRQEEIIRESK